MNAPHHIIGAPMDRTDGIAKVTGAARYAAEHPLPNLAYAVLVTSTIPKGRIAGFDAHEARAVPGVIAIMTHENAPKLPDQTKSGKLMPPIGRVLSLLQYDAVHYNNEPVAVVVADSFEHAREAGARLKVRYDTAEDAVLDFETAQEKLHPPESVLGEPADTRRGDALAGMLEGAVTVNQTYVTPFEHHNPMEPHATIAHWEGDHLTLYDSTQYIHGVRRIVAQTLGMAPEKLRVLCPYIGGGFGCKGSVWSHVVLAAMAAQMAGRPVKLVLDRPQMFGPVGARPVTKQRLALASSTDGKLTASRHDVIAATSMIENWIEPSALITRMMYDCPTQETTHRLASMDIGTPTFMRAPGESTGSFVLESAMDELAIALKMDPIALRMANYAEKDPGKGLPWSSKSLDECYRIGAERFGWSARNPEPGSMRDGDWLIGWGMATATYPTNRSAATASARLNADGSAAVCSGSQDLGTGTYTVMTQVAADTLGLPPEKVHFDLGDTRYPDAPVSGGSTTVASVAPAVRAACEAVKMKLFGIALADAASPLAGALASDLELQDGWLVHKGDTARREAVGEVVARHGKPIAAEASAAPGPEKGKFSMHAFGAVFAEVRVHAHTREVRVPRITAAYGVGKLMNAKTGRSQLLGGIVWGMGMALFEESYHDPETGRIVNDSLAEYHVPVHADIGDIDIIVVHEDDPHVNPLGAKGVGEIGITGVAAAIANGVHHATGRRVRDLPITLDKLL
ncbi:xanthine dehydrogenase family protein molybdopterin-binding subunit [Noviherbaspirillum pedocola]|uniref:Xanthine dehydrogenase family protein molybdopterin-binding subunit n=1 Tax=Noviherbaspirillum pedocola TaxID=2801341 RepID=A0A934T313_9BURK|nr:xanthine dehydrogenase family protein molybdopterin-binding subunit [Noviherbaspirillum pedocola]MBK4738449.1 xanthine dehydrogenase family protein molybdopterin-binding subunit [Noviherbaspirillum pedocola]